MNTRMMLLLLVTGLFVAIWNGDHPRATDPPVPTRIAAIPQDGPEIESNTPQSIEHRTSARNDTGTIPPTVPTASRVETPLVPVKDQPVSERAAQIVIQTVLPLPSKIGPGTYQAVNNLGEIQTLTLTEAQLDHLGLHPESPAQDFHIVHDAERTWYFIRIEQASPAEPAPQRTAPIVDQSDDESHLGRLPRQTWDQLQTEWTRTSNPGWTAFSERTLIVR